MDLGLRANYRITDLKRRLESRLTTAESNITTLQEWGVWTSFTPSYSNLTLGSGATNDGQLCYVPGGMWIRISVILGTSPTVGNATLTIPNSESIYGSPGPAWHPMGTATYRSSGNPYLGILYYNNATSLKLFDDDGIQRAEPIDFNKPFTWAAGDIMRIDAQVPLA